MKTRNQMKIVTIAMFLMQMVKIAVNLYLLIVV